MEKTEAYEEEGYKIALEKEMKSYVDAMKENEKSTKEAEKVNDAEQLSHLEAERIHLGKLHNESKEEYISLYGADGL